MSEQTIEKLHKPIFQAEVKAAFLHRLSIETPGQNEFTRVRSPWDAGHSLLIAIAPIFSPAKICLPCKRCILWRPEGSKMDKISYQERVRGIIGDVSFVTMRRSGTRVNRQRRLNPASLIVGRARTKTVLCYQPAAIPGVGMPGEFFYNFLFFYTSRLAPKDSVTKEVGGPGSPYLQLRRLCNATHGHIGRHAQNIPTGNMHSAESKDNTFASKGRKPTA